MDKIKNFFYVLLNKVFVIKYYLYNVYFEFYRYVGMGCYWDLVDFNVIIKIIFKYLRGFKIIFIIKKF